MSFYGPLMAAGAERNGATLRTRLLLEVLVEAGFRCEVVSVAAASDRFSGDGWTESVVPFPHPLVIEWLRTPWARRRAKPNLGREILHVLGVVGAAELAAVVSVAVSKAVAVHVDLPWLVPTVAPLVGDRPLIVTSHNVESDRFAATDAERGQATARSVLYRALRGLVARFELAQLARASWSVAVTSADLQRFRELGHRGPMSVVPNPVRRPMQLPHVTPARDALFVGSALNPNVAAADWIVSELAPACPDLLFTIVGACGERLTHSPPANVAVVGGVDDAELDRQYADHRCALAPLFTGSGSSIKTIEALAHGLPIIATEVGARGFEPEDGCVSIATGVDGFVSALRTMLAHDGEDLRAARRAFAEPFLPESALRPYVDWITARTARARPHLTAGAVGGRGPK